MSVTDLTDHQATSFSHHAASDAKHETQTET